MRKRARILLAGAIVGLLGFYPLLAPPAHRIDRAHASLISAGMTKEQVVSLLGVPAGSYDWAEGTGPIMVDIVYVVLTNEAQTGRFNFASQLGLGAEQLLVNEVTLDFPSAVAGRVNWTYGAATVHQTWTSRHGSITVYFDQHERVTSTSVSDEVKIVPPWQRWWRQHVKK